MVADRDEILGCDREERFAALVKQVYQRDGLVLVPMQPSDRALFVGLYTNPQVIHHIPFAGDAETAGQWFARAIAGSTDKPMFHWIMRQQVGDQGFGLIALKRHSGTVAEIGLMIEPAFMHQGYGLKALSLLRDHCFATEAVTELQLHTAQANIAMVTVARRAGFTAQQHSDFWYWRQTLAEWWAAKCLAAQG